MSNGLTKIYDLNKIHALLGALDKEGIPNATAAALTECEGLAKQFSEIIGRRLVGNPVNSLEALDFLERLQDGVIECESERILDMEGTA